MASRAELERLRASRFQAELDREFAAKHGYDAAFWRKSKEIKDMERTILRAKGLS